MTMLDDIVTYSKELFSGWRILLGIVQTLLLAASVLTAVLRLDLILSSTEFLIVFCVLLVPAGFQVWRQTHHRIKELESKDADIQLVRVSGEESIEITVPDSYRLILNLVPHTVAIWVNFNLHNYGEHEGTLDEVRAETKKWPHTELTSLRPEGLYCRSQRGADPIKGGDIFRPHQPRQVSYRLTYSVAAETQTPEQFAGELRQLADLDVNFVWSFTGRYGRKEPGHVEVTVPVTQIRELICSYWENEPSAERLKDRLIKIAKTPIGTPH
jgi:hypothetical protein